jgi:hypothetical protein
MPSLANYAKIQIMGMYPLTIEVPDELARRLKDRDVDVPQIIELGLREVDAQHQFQYDGAADVLEFLAGLPTPQEVLALRPSPVLQVEIEELLEKNSALGLSSEEEKKWEQVEYLEHLIRIAKAQATLKLNE